MDYIRDVCKTCGKNLVKAKYTIPNDGDYCFDTDCYKQSPVWIEGQKEESRVCEKCHGEFITRKQTGHKICHTCLKTEMDKYSESMAHFFKK